MRRSLSPLFVLTSCLLASCTVGPDYASPRLDAPGWWHAHADTENEAQQVAPVSGAAVVPGPQAGTQQAVPVVLASDNRRWWEAFGDPMLDHLIDRALEGSPTLKIAESRIYEARASRKTTASALFPQITGDGRADRIDLGLKQSGTDSNGGAGGGTTGSGNDTFSKLSDPFNLYDADIDASWQIDLFGGIRRQTEAATANLQARKADLREARLTLIGDVADAYIDWIYYQQQAELTRSLAAAQQELSDIAGKKFQAGLSSSLDESQADTLYKQTIAKVPGYEQQRDAAGFRLSVLLGAPVGEINDLLKTTDKLPAPAAIPALDAPAEILRRRPDVASAERLLASDTALQGAAIAELFPKISLSAMFGYVNTTLAPATTNYNFGATASVPLLNFGRIEGQIEQADARQEQAFQNYRRTVLQAMAEVETDLVTVSKTNSRVIALDAALASATQSLNLAKERYGIGLCSFTDVLEAQSAFDNAKVDQVTGSTDLLRAVIRLCKALAIGEPEIQDGSDKAKLDTAAVKDQFAPADKEGESEKDRTAPIVP